MALPCIICEIKRDIGLAFDAPAKRRGSSSEYCHPVWCGKARMVGLSDGDKKNCEDVYNRLDIIPACDRQIDGRTDRHFATA